MDDLQCGGYFLYQKKTAFCFGTDAVLLADFAGKRIKKNAKTIDLCTGNGIIPILVCARRNDLMIDAVEIDSETAQLAEHNISVNALQKKVRMICADIKDLPKSFYGTYDAVTVNPPYIPLGRGLLSETPKQCGARHELFATLEEIIRTSASLLKEKGVLFMVHRSNRTAEILCTLRESDLQPKMIRFVHKDPLSASNLILIGASKHSGEWTDILPPLFLRDSDGNETEELSNIYNRKPTI
ncbi:MAG: tRNA1(Val) (adenine(37)-N6)-methyltransferase [Anaerofustis sp.]